MRKPKSSIASMVIFLLFTLGFMQSVFAQKPAKTNIFPATGSAGIGTISPHSSSLLEMKSTTQGFLPPRMRMQDMLGIVGPDRGLTVFVTDGDAPGYYYNNGVSSSDWQPLSQSGSGSGANQALSNLSNTAINTNLFPANNGSIDLGNPNFAWRNLYLSGSAYANSATEPAFVGLSLGLIGIRGEGVNYGVYGKGLNGIYGEGTSYGVYGKSMSGGILGEGNQYGVRGIGGGEAGTGVVGISTNGTGIIGSAAVGQYAGYFNGSVFSSVGFTPSDKNLKLNVKNISDAMEIINKLNPTQYEYRNDGNYKLMNLPQGNRYGLIAQDVEKVLPGLIKETKFDPNIIKSKKKDNESEIGLEGKMTEAVISFKAMSYTELIPIMIKGMQELSKTNEEKDAAIKDLQKQMDELKQLIKANSGSTTDKLNLTQPTVDLSNIGSLEQNTPNPFTGTTSIHYNLLRNDGNAFINFYSSSGVVLKTVKLSATGKGVVDIKTSELTPGIYQYSLVVGGKVIDTKQMVKLK